MTDQPHPNQLSQPIDQEPAEAEPKQPVAADLDTSAPEHGGPKGLEPTRFGDWERNGRCSDF